VTCESCGAQLPERAKFCLECGAPVASSSPAHEQRKTVTLLFTDVTGSTALGEQLDPEAYRAVMGRYFEVARAAVGRHGGTVEKFVGDAVLAVFGIPEVREDDALRAVRAAHELMRELADLSDELGRTMGVRLEVRTGVNTGSVVAGSARAGGSFATGDAVNTAARLEQAAPPGEVLLGQVTHELVRDAVDVEPVGPVPAKGKAEPVPAYRLLAVRDSERGRARRVDTQLVGREREIRVLQDALDRTLESGRGHLVTVVGAPGIGKSRLVTEFLAGIGDRADVLSGRCVSYGSGITFWPVVQLLRQALGLHGGESEEVVRHAVGTLLSEARDGEQVAERLLPLLGHGGATVGQDDTVWAVRRALEQLALRRPVVVTVDDLHWAEPTLLDLIERVRDEVRDLPLLLVCQTRPELLEEHPEWGGGSLNSVTFGLEPFTSAQTSASLHGLLGGPVADGVSETVAAWAGGNPLFVEEVVADLRERGLLRRDGDGWSLERDLASTQVPPTVAALLAARLDRLPRRERELVEQISVVGLEVTTEDAVALTGADPAEVVEGLSALVHRDLVRRQRSAAGDTWTFRHILLREAAYESLPKAQRSELHERYAARVASLTDDVGAEGSAFVAHHLEQALRFRAELAPHDPGIPVLAERVRAALVEAAGLARDREDFPAATAFLRRAERIEPLPPALRRDVLVRLIQLFSDQELVDEYGAAVAALADATDADATELDRTAVELLGLTHRMNRSEPVDPAEVLAVASRCAGVARAAGHHRLLALSLRIANDCYGMRSRWDAVTAGLEELREVGGAHDRRYARMMTGGALLWGSAPLTRLDEFVRHQQEEGERGPQSPADKLRLACMRAAAGAGLGRAGATDELRDYVHADGAGMLRIHQLQIVGSGLLLAGDPVTAADLYDESMRIMLAAGDLAHASTLIGWVAALRLEVGTEPVAVAELVDLASDTTSPHDVVSVAYREVSRGLLFARLGDHDGAAPHLAEAVQVIDDSDQLWQQAEMRRWSGLAARWRGDRAEERRLFAEAHDRFRRKEIAFWADETAARVAELG
jgi:class 3 adenylate cyclase